MDSCISNPQDVIKAKLVILGYIQNIIYSVSDNQHTIDEDLIIKASQTYNVKIDKDYPQIELDKIESIEILNYLSL